MGPAREERMSQEKRDAKAAERSAREHILAAQRFVLANRIEDEGP
jgi:hypothetical protein